MHHASLQTSGPLPPWCVAVPRVASVLALALIVTLASNGYGADRGADGKFEKRTSSHFVLFQDVDIDRSSGFRGSRRFEQQVLEVLELAYVRIDQLLGLRPERPITVTIYDPRIFDATYSGLFRYPAAGFYGGEIHIRGNTVVTEGLARTLYHELAHAALDAAAPSLVIPAWFNEGIAEWFEARASGKRVLSDRERATLARASADGRLFSLARLSAPSLGHLGPDAAHLAYLQSYGFFVFLARNHGEKKLLELLDDYLRRRHLERAFRRTFRADLPRLEARYAEELSVATR
jgi:hypothetical protein